MTEEFLQNCWKYQWYSSKSYFINSNEKLEIINVGIHNYDSGPDFFGTKIKIGDTLLIGNAEVHLKSSDWYKHNHHNDKAYENVVLHIVLEFDKEVQIKGQNVLTYVIKVDENVINNYNMLLNENYWLACKAVLNEVSNLEMINWLESLFAERLKIKANKIIEELELCKGDWNSVLYKAVFSSMGLKVNSLPFEILANSISPKLFLKKQYDRYLVESILYGVAGFFNKEIPDDEYYNKLKNDFFKIKNLYSLKEMDRSLWKFSKTRPSSFPTIRISQLSAIICSGEFSIDKIINIKSFEDLFSIFSKSALPYWENHTDFGKKSEKINVGIGRNTINNIIINSIAPIIFAYKESFGFSNDDVTNRLLEILYKMPPESNKVIREWEENKIIPKNTIESQALLQLKNEYCSKKNCLNCRIGISLITKRTRISYEKDEQV